jgi:hypothetical protein
MGKLKIAPIKFETSRKVFLKRAVSLDGYEEPVFP